MSDQDAWLCAGCPGKGNNQVDLDVDGRCFSDMIDSFRQARRWVLEDSDYRAMSVEEAADGVVMNGIRYSDDEEEVFERPAHRESARLGALCAQRFLRGKCAKTESQIIIESEVD